MTLPDFVMVYVSAEKATSSISAGDIVKATVLFGTNKAIGVTCEMQADGAFTLTSVDAANYPFRKSFDSYDYEPWTTDTNTALRCAAALDIKGKDGSSFIFEAALPVFVSFDLITGGNTVSIVSEKTESLTLKKTDYKFGDEYEVSDKPKAIEGPSKSEKFAISWNAADPTAVGYLKMDGGYKVLPNFETLLFRVTLSVEMPEELFTESDWYMFYLSYTKNSDPTAGDNVVCAVQANDPLSAEVLQYSTLDTDQLASANLLTSNEANLAEW